MSADAAAVADRGCVERGSQVGFGVEQSTVGDERDRAVERRERVDRDRFVADVLAGAAGCGEQRPRRRGIAELVQRRPHAEVDEPVTRRRVGGGERGGDEVEHLLSVAPLVARLDRDTRGFDGTGRLPRQAGDALGADRIVALERAAGSPRPRPPPAAVGRP